MELLLKSAEINLPQEIANLEQLKAELAPKLEKYNSLVVTEDSIKEAKADKANLNKLKKAIEDQRIEIKKQYLEPYNVLEGQCKEVVRLIDAPIQAIDSQIKAFDEKEREEKYSELKAFFDGLPHAEWFTIDDVLNPKWANKTEKVCAIKADMTMRCQKLEEEYEHLEILYNNFPHKLAILDRFKSTKDFSETMVYAKNLESQYEKEMKRKEQEAQRAAKEPQPVEPESITNAEAPQLITGRFEVTGTAEQITALGVYMKSNNIRFTILK